MTLEELLVRIKVENKQAVKGLEEAKKAADQATGRFDGLRKKLTELGRALGKKPKAEAAKELEKGLKDADRAIAQTERRLQSLQRTASKRTESSDFKSLQEEAKQAEKTIEELARRREKMREAALAGKYGAPETQLYNEQKAVFDRLRSDENETRDYLKGIQTRMGEMIADGSAYVQSESAKAAGAQIRVEQANLERLKRFRESLNANLEGAVSNPALQRLQAFLNGVRKAGAGIKNFASKSVKALKGVVSWIEKMGRGFGTVLSKIPLLNRIPKTLKKIKRGLFMGSGMRSLIRLGFAGFFVYRSVQMMREGFKNLAQYSSQTNSDLSMLMSSLATLKNALATAFAPILTAIAPALNTLIQLLVKAATAVAHFTAAFTGKSTVVVAKQQTVDYAASLDDAADAAGSANDAAKEYQKTLLGFDQMNVLNDMDKSSGSAGSGGGGGAGGVGDMFETVEVSSGAKSLVDRIKEAWKNADFTDLGRDIGNSIADALNKIPWEKLQNVAYKIGKSIATGFNGLNDSAFWSSLGHAVAESLNTILTGIEGFVFNFDWKKAGKALADGINHLFLDFDWKKLGKTFSEGAKGILDALKSLFDNIKWEDVGRSVMSAITSVDWIGIIVSGIKAAGSLADGILGFLKGAFEDAAEGVSEWITSGEMWKDIKSLGKATFEVGINLIGAAWDTIETALNGIWNVVSSIGEKLGIVKGLGSSAVSGMPGNVSIKESVTKGLVPRTVQSIVQSSPLLSGVWGIAKSLPSIKKLFENDEVSFSKELGEIWKDIKNTFGKKNKGKDYSRLSIADAFGWNPLNSGSSLFDSIAKTGSQAKVKVVAELTKTEDKVPVSQKTVKNMLASLERKKETFGKTAEGMIAGLSTKKETFGKTVTDMVASFNSRTLGGKFDTTIYGMTSSFAKRAVGKGFDATIYGMTSSFSKRTTSSGFSYWLSGFTAQITKVSLASSAKNLIMSITGKADGGLYRNGRWLPVTAAAAGGSFSTGQMFIAREAGPELVGRIGRGTSVMNNDQIVASVSAGVYEAVLAAMSGNEQSVNVYLMGDAGKLFKAVQKEAVQYTNTTGLSPFPA